MNAESSSLSNDNTVRFEIANTGGAPLMIERVAASCGCTSVSVTSNLIQPGHSEELVAEVELPESERNTISIYVHSNDPTSPTTMLRLLVGPAKEPPYVSFNNGPLRFGLIGFQQKDVHSIKLLIGTVETSDYPWLIDAFSNSGNMLVEGGLLSEKRMPEKHIDRLYEFWTHSCSFAQTIQKAKSFMSHSL